jgi:hypothetical protein
VVGGDEQNRQQYPLPRNHSTARSNAPSTGPG